MAHNTYNAAYNFAYNEGGLVKFVWKNLWAPARSDRDNQGQDNHEQQNQQQQQQHQQQPANNRDYNGGGNNYNNQPQRPIGG